MPVRSAGSASRTGAESSARGETLSARKVPVGTAGDRQRGAQRQRLELLAEPDAVRLREPLVRPAARLARRSARAPRSRRRGPSRARRPAGRRSSIAVGPALEQRRDLVALLGLRAHRAAHVAHGLAAPRALGPVQRGVGVLEQHGGLVAVGRRGGDARGRGQRAPAHGQLGQRGPRALGAVLGGLGVGARQDQHELLAAQAPDDVAGRARPSAGARPTPRARDRPRRGRARR